MILETIPEDTGKYECVAINNAGEARCEAECTVRGPQSPTKVAKPTTPTVEKAPTVLEPLKDQTIKEGTSVAFACRITGKPVPTVQWKKADKVYSERCNNDNNNIANFLIRVYSTAYRVCR